MTDILLEMDRLSPIQKNWMQKPGQRVKTYDHVLHELGLKTNAIWRPRQEDLQEIYAKSGVLPKKRVRDLILEVFDAFILDKPREIDISGSKYMDYAWRLFIHKELYYKVWDWDKSLWVEV